MKLSVRELLLLIEALGYGIALSNDEPQTIDFALLKIKIETEIIRQENEPT